MKGTLFENQIQEYGHIFQKDNVYQISNAPLESVKSKYKDWDGECSLRFGKQTMVQPIATEIIPNKAHYMPLASVSYDSDLDDRYDILGLVLFISDIRTITSEQGIEHPVRDISVIDHKSTFKFYAVDDTGILSLTAFAEDCEKLFKLTIIEIFEQTNTGTLDFGSIARDLSNDFYIAVGPSYILTKKGVLSWVLKDVSRT
uniref:Uncharacterized protein n=1 Tax=Chenopodium quinoa TaxID=63459 RepID=A0A803LSL3_CHEQI